MAEAQTQENPESNELVKLAQSDLSRARRLVVKDNDSYRECCALELQIKASIKEVEKKLDPVVKSTRVAWKAALQLKADAIDPREEALEIVRKARIDYETEREEKRKTREIEATREAQQKAIQDAEKLSGILEQAGETDLAKAIKENVPLPTVKVESEVPAIKGIKTTEKWFFEVIDEGKVARAYMAIDERKIQGLVNTQHKDAEQIVGGIRVWSAKV